MNIDDLISKGILSIRSATINDIDDIVPFINQAYRGESSAKGWTTESSMLEGQRLDIDMAKDIITKENCDILLLSFHIDNISNNVNDSQKKFIDHVISLHDNTKKAMIVATVNPEQEDDIMHLNMLAIHPELQSYGIGKYMINRVEENTKACGLSKVVLTVISIRSELVSYYERRGYRMNGNKHRFPAYDNPRFGIPKRDDLELHEMEKVL
jgi:N-acetylglutamate synthase-like GNAT family acetyltransferase